MPADMWDLDEPFAPWPTRVRRAAAVAGVWVLSALPVVTGLQRCPVATVFHRPCPGCGMTRALRLLGEGDVGASLRMHPLAVPVLAAGLFFIAATVWTTLALGSPLHLVRTRLGRVAIGALVVVYSAALVVWGLRWFGLLGGPVPVY
jgi:hypothetical protein